MGLIFTCTNAAVALRGARTSQFVLLSTPNGVYAYNKDPCVTHWDPDHVIK